jgi:hypothetical protein
MSFKERLAAMQDAYAAGKDQAGGIPDGVYTMQLQSAVLQESSSGRMMVHREHIVLEGEYQGEVVHDFIVLDTEFGPRQFAEWCRIMGFDAPEQAADIEDVVAAIALKAPQYQAAVKKSRDSDLRNVRIRQLIETGETAKPMPKPAAKPASGKPVAKPATSAGKVAVEFPVNFDPLGDGTIVTGVAKRKTPSGNTIVEYNGELYELEPGDIKIREEESEAEAEPETSAEAPAEDTAELLAFCQAHEIECAEDDARDALVERINQYEFKRSELTTEEVKLVESIGGNFEKVAVKPAPKPTPKPAAKPAPKASAKPTPKPTPKKKGK